MHSTGRQEAPLRQVVIVSSLRLTHKATEQTRTREVLVSVELFVIRNSRQKSLCLWCSGADASSAGHWGTMSLHHVGSACLNRNLSRNVGNGAGSLWNGASVVGADIASGSTLRSGYTRGASCRQTSVYSATSKMALVLYSTIKLHDGSGIVVCEKKAI